MADLGFGVIRPFQRDAKNDFAATGGVDLVKSSVGQVLATVAQSDVTQGELPWRPEFGASLAQLRFRSSGPVTQELARVRVQEALQRWEPRVRVTSVTTNTFTTSEGETGLALRVRYDIFADRVGNAVAESGVEALVPLL